jgi:hypothetical protein
MPRVQSTPPMPLYDTAPSHPAWALLEAQGLDLEKIRVLAEFIACDDSDGDMNVLADCILDVVARAERQRMLALDTLRRAREKAPS